MDQFFLTSQSFIKSLIVSLSMVFALTISVQNVQATTYYVDPDITDTNIASATPDFTTYDPQLFQITGGSDAVYKTIADINLKTLLPGDSVLFKRGGSWTGTQLLIPSSGDSSNPITYGAFGSGNKPLLNGNLSAQRNIHTNGKNYLVIENLELKNATAFGIFVSGGTDIQINSVESHNNKIEGIRIAGKNVTVTSGKVYDNGGTANHVGIWFSGDVTDAVLDGVEVYDSGSGTQKQGIYTYEASGAGTITIKNCHIHSHPRYGADIMNLNEYHIVNNHFEDNGWGSTFTSGDFTWREGNMKIHDGAHDSIIENNVFEGGYGWGVDSYLSTGNIFRNNVFIGNYDRDASPVGPGIGLEINSSTGTEVYNNTFYGNTIGLQVTYEDSQAVETSITLTNNIFYNNSSGIDYYKYPEDHSSISAETNLTGVNPLFVDAASGNVRLLSTSPAIDSGTTIAGLTSDKESNVYYGRVDIGAFEFQPVEQLTNTLLKGNSITIYGDGTMRYSQAPTTPASNLSITPATQFTVGDTMEWMSLMIHIWSTSGDFKRLWTETSSAIGSGHVLHMIGDLQAGHTYYLTIDGQAADTNRVQSNSCSNGLCVADNLGTISFTYTGGYSTHTFEMADTTTSSSAGNSLTESKPTSCVLPQPVGVPDLFQINRTKSSAILYFSPLNSAVQTYHVVYGFAEGDERFGGLMMSAQNENKGVQSITVNDLDPHAMYSFKVIGVNGCALGEWSNWLTTTKSYAKESIFYRYWNAVKLLN